MSLRKINNNPYQVHVNIRLKRETMHINDNRKYCNNKELQYLNLYLLEKEERYRFHGQKFYVRKCKSLLPRVLVDRKLIGYLIKWLDFVRFGVLICWLLRISGKCSCILVAADPSTFSFLVQTSDISLR